MPKIPLHPKLRLAYQQKQQALEEKKLQELLSDKSFNETFDYMRRDFAIRRAEEARGTLDVSPDVRKKFEDLVANHLGDQISQSEKAEQSDFLLRMTWQVAKWWKKRGKLKLPAPNGTHLRKSAGIVQKLIAQPLYNPALAFGEFEKWPFWKLPAMLEAFADFTERAFAEVGKMSRKDDWLPTQITMLEHEFRKLTGRFNPGEVSELFSSLDPTCSVSEDNIKKALQLAKYPPQDVRKPFKKSPKSPR